METQSGFFGNRFISSSYILFTLLGAVLLTALGFINQRIWPSPPQQQVQLTVLCVNGFSWDRVMSLHRHGELPFLASLFLKKGSYGDIVSSKQFASDDAIIASLFTGRLPVKHRIYKTADRAQLCSNKRFQIPVWQELAEQGETCIVVGLPAASDHDVIPPREAPQPVHEEILTKHIQYITRGRELPLELLHLLRECIGSDLERISLAVEAVAAYKPSSHLFACFEGLGRWQKRLSAGADSLPEPLRSELTDSYYKFFDTLLAKLQGRLGENGTFLLLSERGNLKGYPTYWQGLPRRREYPAAGFLYATGRHIREGTEPLLVKPVDIVPTLIYLTGNPLLNDMDGTVIFDMLEEEFYFQHKLSYK